MGLCVLGGMLNLSEPHFLPLYNGTELLPRRAAVKTRLWQGCRGPIPFLPVPDPAQDTQTPPCRTASCIWSSGAPAPLPSPFLQMSRERSSLTAVLTSATSLTLST